MVTPKGFVLKDMGEADLKLLQKRKELQCTRVVKTGDEVGEDSPELWDPSTGPAPVFSVDSRPVCQVSGRSPGTVPATPHESKDE